MRISRGKVRISDRLRSMLVLLDHIVNVDLKRSTHSNWKMSCKFT
jgi:hypothetical protein